MKKTTITIYILVILLLCSFGGLYKLNKDNQYYQKVIKGLGSEELIYYPELYSEGYLDQINVHNCMWAIDMCECAYE